jgi:activator of HSP90 ATPase
MSETTDRETVTTEMGRRRAIVRAAAVCGGLLLSGEVRAESVKAEIAAQASKEPPCKPTNSQRTSLHQEVDLPVSPERVYHALLDSKQFTAFSGMPAEIEATPGGAFAMFGKIIFGRNVELISDQRIVQAWGDKGWDSGVYSLAKFELKAQGSHTHLVLDHTGFPEGSYDHLYEGWFGHYWEPLKKFFAS